MPIALRCPKGHKLNVPSKYAGKTVRCPACQSPLEVPGSGSVQSKLSAKHSAKQQKKSPRRAEEPRPEKQPTVSAVDREPVAAEIASAPSQSVQAIPSPPPPPPEVELPVLPPAIPPTMPKNKVADHDPQEMFPRGPVPEARLVPGANQINRLVELFKERRWLVSRPGYRPQQKQRESVYWLAGGQVLLALFSAMPAVWQLGAEQPGSWVYVVLMLSFLQLAYAVWICLSPDFSSAQVAMFFTGMFAAIYAAATAVTWLSKPRAGGWLDLGTLKMEFGGKPALWCAAVVLLASLTAYFCGHVSYRWRKTYGRLVTVKTK